MKEPKIYESRSSGQSYSMEPCNGGFIWVWNGIGDINTTADGVYMTREELDEWKAQQPIERLRNAAPALVAALKGLLGQLSQTHDHSDNCPACGRELQSFACPNPECTIKTARAALKEAE